MDSKDLKFFLQVCKDKSIRKAASNLYITHQGLSKSLINLENEIGAKLFNRTRNGIELTQNGDIVLKYVEQILYEVECMNDELHQERNESVTLPLACSFGVKSALSPEFLLAYNKINSKINLQVTEKPDLLVDEAVIEEKAAIGFTIGPVDTGQFDAVSIKKHDLYLLVHKSNPLARKDRISIFDLKDEKFILFNKDFRIRHLITRKCEEAGFSPNIVIEIPEVIMAHKFSHLNYGVAVTVDLFLGDFKHKDVIALPFEDEECVWEIYMITKKGIQHTPIVRNFMNFVKDWGEYSLTNKLAQA
jgi:DNA-binding transcriptional LysR family regulator